MVRPAGSRPVSMMRAASDRMDKLEADNIEMKGLFNGIKGHMDEMKGHMGEMEASLAKISRLLWKKQMGEIKANLAMVSKALGLPPTEEKSTTTPQHEGVTTASTRAAVPTGESMRNKEELEDGEKQIFKEEKIEDGPSGLGNTTSRIDHQLEQFNTQLDSEFASMEALETGEEVVDMTVEVHKSLEKKVHVIEIQEHTSFVEPSPAHSLILQDSTQIHVLNSHECLHNKLTSKPRHGEGGIHLIFKVGRAGIGRKFFLAPDTPNDVWAEDFSKWEPPKTAIYQVREKMNGAAHARRNDAKKESFHEDLDDLDPLSFHRRLYQHRLQNCTTLNEEDICQQQKDTISQIFFLSISSVAAGILICQYNWSIRRVNDEPGDLWLWCPDPSYGTVIDHDLVKGLALKGVATWINKATSLYQFPHFNLEDKVVLKTDVIDTKQNDPNGREPRAIRLIKQGGTGLSPHSWT